MISFQSVKSTKLTLFRRYWGYLYSILAIVLILLTLMLTLLLSAKAQQPAQWFPHQKIPGSQDLAEVPYMLADQNGTVHVFHSLQAGGLFGTGAVPGIFYNNWTQETGWTLPVDIVIPFSGDLVVLQGAFLDQMGTIHIIFYCCQDRNSHIYYSFAPARLANRAPAWSKPELIGVNASWTPSAAVIGDDQGNLHVVYYGDLQGKGVYSVHSTDGGGSWSDPMLGFPVTGGLFPVEIQVDLDQNRDLHALWALNDPTGTSREIRFATFKASEMAWSDSVLIAEAGERDGRLNNGLVERLVQPSFVQFQDETIIIYLVCSPCERRMLRSVDGGRTWTSPVDPFGTSRGDHGNVDFVVDSNEDLHIIYGDRADGLTLWHSVWQEGHWQGREPVVSPAVSQCGGVKPDEYCPDEPRAVISLGNRLLITWRHDTGPGQNGLWYSFTTLGSPELTRVPLPTLGVTPTFSPEPTITPVQPTAIPAFPNQNNVFADGTSNVEPIYIGIVPAVVVVLVIFVLRFISLNHRQR